MAPQVQAALLVRRAVREGHVPVRNVIEEVDLVLVEHEARRDGVDGGITPPLVEEAAVAVQRLEEVGVGLRAEPVEAADLKVGPLREVLVCDRAQKGRCGGGRDLRSGSGCTSRRHRR